MIVLKGDMMTSLKSFLLSNETEKNFSHIDIFKQVSEEISDLLAKEGKTVQPYHSSDLNFFKILDSDQKVKVVSDIRSYLKICLETVNSGNALSNSRQLTWKALQELGLLPTSDLFTKMSDEHVIAIYNSENKQIFRNLKFFDVSSYSLEDLYCRSWYDLYCRDKECEKIIMQNSISVFRGERDMCFNPQVPEHILSELDSPFKFDIKINVEYLSPLYNESKQVAAAVTIDSCEIMNREIVEPKKDLNL